MTDVLAVAGCWLAASVATAALYSLTRAYWRTRP